jgi:hypothetical protein
VVCEGLQVWKPMVVLLALGGWCWSRVVLVVLVALLVVTSWE